MKEFYRKYKNIILVLGITFVVFFLYTSFFAGGSSDDFLQSESVGGEEETLIGRELLTTLLELRSLSLDESIFSDNAFVILRDFSQEVQPQATGRPNPFSNIGVDIVDSNQGGAPQEEGSGDEEGSEN